MRRSSLILVGLALALGGCEGGAADQSGSNSPGAQAEGVATSPAEALEERGDAIAGTAAAAVAAQERATGDALEQQDRAIEEAGDGRTP
jgi:hypothetical protein